MASNLNPQGELVRDLTYRGQRQIQIIECKYSTDGNIQTIINHIYDIYEPLRLALQTHGTLKTEVKIIPVVICRTDTFHVKTLAEIAQLVSFKEEPPDELTFKQLTLTAKRIAMAIHVHAQEWLSYISKTSRKILTTKRPQTLNISTENVCPKTSLILAAGVEEEDDEQADTAYMVGSFNLP